jgi:SAM-dependent methyltransferase
LDYDPIKDRLGAVARKSPALTKAFYQTLDAVFLRSWYVRRKLRELIEGLPKDRIIEVLDAGTGFGQYTYWLLKTFPNVHVTAVDVKTDYLENIAFFLSKTPYLHRVRLYERDLIGPPPEVEKGRYDLVLSVDVMEHILDDRAVFRGFREVLKPGGHVVVNTPSDLGGSGITEENEESFIGEHVRDGYPIAELREKLETAGLRVTDHEYAYGPIGMSAWRVLVQGPIQALGKSFWLAPAVAAYYAAAMPVGLALNAADLARDNREGAGHLMVAQRPDQS